MKDYSMASKMGILVRHLRKEGSRNKSRLFPSISFGVPTSGEIRQRRLPRSKPSEWCNMLRSQKQRPMLKASEECLSIHPEYGVAEPHHSIWNLGRESCQRWRAISMLVRQQAAHAADLAASWSFPRRLTELPQRPDAGEF
jgi:hypothetical protein